MGVNREEQGMLVGEYQAQAVGVRSMRGPKAEPHAVSRIDNTEEIHSAPVVFSAPPPPEMIGPIRRLEERPPVTTTFAAPPPTYAGAPSVYAGAPAVYAGAPAVVEEVVVGGAQGMVVEEIVATGPAAYGGAYGVVEEVMIPGRAVYAGQTAGVQMVETVVEPVAGV